MARQSDSAPEFVKFMGPVLGVLSDLGGSGRPDEVRSAIVKALKISEDEQAQRLPSGNRRVKHIWKRPLRSASCRHATTQGDGRAAGAA